MEETSGLALSNKTKYCGVIGLLILLGSHLIPYLNEYTYPSFDYFNVLHVLNYLSSPELFAPDRITTILAQASTRTAPIYFYGIGYPLHQILPGKWTLLFIGSILTVGSFYFAGGRWTRWRSLIVALMVVIVLLHTNVSPLEGNRRSFTGIVLLALLWLEDHPSYLAKLLLTAIAAGVYPPVALLVLTYFAIQETKNCWFRERNNQTQALLRLSGLSVVFLTVLTPYWSNLLMSETHSAPGIFTHSIRYRIGSVFEFMNTFIIGNRNVMGALFRDQLHFEITLILLVTVGFEKLVLGKRFELKNRYLFLGLTGIGLWGLAHLVHPLIYHPFKYTRITLILVLVMPLAENLPRTVKRLRQQFSTQPALRFALTFISVWLLGIWVLYVIYPEGFSYLEVPGLFGNHWWKFVFGFPVFIASTVMLPNSWNRPTLRSLLAGLVLMGLVFFPHGFPHYDRHGMQLRDFDSLFEFLETTPPGTRVAGPPLLYLDTIPALAKRNVYTSPNKTMLDVACRRIDKFWEAYFKGSPDPIATFMKNNEIDYLLVDRRFLKARRAAGTPRCLGSYQGSSTFYLNRHFPGASWQFGQRFYLIDRGTLQSRNS